MWILPGAAAAQVVSQLSNQQAQGVYNQNQANHNQLGSQQANAAQQVANIGQASNAAAQGAAQAGLGGAVLHQGGWSGSLAQSSLAEDAISGYNISLTIKKLLARNNGKLSTHEERAIKKYKAWEHERMILDERMKWLSKKLSDGDYTDEDHE